MSPPSEATVREAERQLAKLLEVPVVRSLAALPAEWEVLLVGGVVRDRLLGVAARDIDAVVVGAGEAAAEAMATELEARPFRLGGERFAAYRLETADTQLDLWDRSPLSVEDDLRRRDLTINSMAFRLSDRSLLDPFGGLGDLENQTLRATSENSFQEDPLRVVRLARFAVQLPRFEAEDETIQLARASAEALDSVASERIREELRYTLSEPGGARALELLGAVGVYPRLWAPATDWHPGPEVAGRFERLERRCDELANALPTGAVDRFLAFQATLFDQAPRGGELARAAHARGLFSNRELRAIEAHLSWRRLGATHEDLRWFLHRLGALWPSALAYLGSAMEEPEWQSLNEPLLELAATRGHEIFAPPPLLDGHQISEVLSLPPGPRLGEAAGELRRAQVEGRLSTPEAATAWLERWAKAGDGAG